MSRLELETYPRRWGIASAALILYILVFFLLYPLYHENTAVLAALPLAAIAWLGGVRLGIFMGVMSIPLNTLLLNLVEPRAHPWRVLIESGGVPGSLAILLTTCVIGILRDRQTHLARQFAERDKVETARGKSEQRYRALFESAQRQAQELGLLDRVRQALARELELPLIFRTVVEGVAQTFGYTQVSLYLVDGATLVLQYQVGYDHIIERIPVMKGIIGRVVRTGEPVFLEDVTSDPAFLGAIEGITSEVCVPLFDKGQVRGALNVESRLGIKLHQADLDLMVALAQQISIAFERARLYNEIRESEQRFRQLAEHIQQVFWLEDSEGSRIIYVSPAYEPMWGRTRKSLYEEPNSWFDAIHPNDRERVLIAQGQKTGGTYNLEYRIVQPNGSLRWVWSRAFPINDEQGRVYRIAGIAEDITDRKSAESELRSANEKQAQWLKELEHRTRALALLNELIDQWQACRTPAEAYGLIPLFGRQLFPEDAGALYLFNSAHAHVQCVAAWNLPQAADALSNPEDCYALREGSLFIIDMTLPSNGRQSSQADLFCQHVQPPYPVATLCMPLVAQGEALGVFHLRSQIIQPQTEPIVDKETGQHFPAAKQELVRTLTDSLALALTNLNLRETLHEQAIRDPLTGLFNRRYLEETLEREVKRGMRGPHPLSLIMLDLDHFKEFNDTFGHDAGDAVLKTLGTFLQSRVRGEDIACRYGGEEFMLVLPQASLEITVARAEQLRKEVKDLVVWFEGQPLGAITLSFGVATFPEHGRTHKEVLRSADDALYRAKREGRDRVAVAALS